MDALKVGGERDNRFGIICRATSPNSFYTFIISSDGYYGIGKINGQEYHLIGMDALQPSSAILKGSALNHLRADCIGDTLTLYVNDNKLIEVRDSEFPAGDIGLIAGTYQTAGTDIRFDNLQCLQAMKIYLDTIGCRLNQAEIEAVCPPVPGRRPYIGRRARAGRPGCCEYLCGNRRSCLRLAPEDPPDRARLGTGRHRRSPAAGQR